MAEVAFLPSGTEDSACSPHLSAGTDETRKPSVTRHGFLAPSRSGSPTGSASPGSPCRRRDPRGASPRQAPSDRLSASAHSNRRHTNPGTTPTRYRACHKPPGVCPLLPHWVRLTARVRVEPTVLVQQLLFHCLRKVRLSTETPRPAFPARHAYSHCASVGNSYRRLAAFSPGNSDSLRQNSTASSQETCSTGLFGSPWNLLGLLPITRWYSSCVTCVTPSQYGLVIRTRCCGPSLGDGPCTSHHRRVPQLLLDQFLRRAHVELARRDEHQLHADGISLDHRRGKCLDQSFDSMDKIGGLAKSVAGILSILDRRRHEDGFYEPRNGPCRATKLDAAQSVLATTPVPGPLERSAGMPPEGAVTGSCLQSRAGGTTMMRFRQEVLLCTG